MEQGIEESFSSVISKAMFKFALTSLYKYASVKPKEDFVFSPYNIYHGLYSAYMISSGDMEQRLKDVLYIPNVSKNMLMKIINFNKYPERRPARYEGSTFYMPYHYVIENKCIFLNKKLRGGIRTKEKLYNIGLQSLISNDIEYTNRELNIILQSLTRNHFRNPVNLKIETEDMDIFLASIHNFKGRNQIVSQSTSESTCDAPILSTPSYLNFKTFSSDELQVHVQELIIKEHFTSLYILKPYSSSTNTNIMMDMSIKLSSLIERLSTSEGMNILRELLSRVRTVEPLSLATRPTFEIENNLNMRHLLRELGVERLLTTDAIPLDNTFVKIDQSAHFGNAVHRARVKVTQEDVTAAAVTVISGQVSRSNDIIITDMHIIYPCLWLIYDKMNKDILYIGVFNNIDCLRNEDSI